jgi:pimeloyl-ACP methyl ester carboxylesterase
VAYASQQGYPTLAIDRLGHGVSDYPDPILVVQDPAHVEITNALIQAARAGTAPLPRAFDKIIYVGHSFGSLIGNLFNSKYPTALDATILTGWSNYFLVDVIPVAFTLLLLPASIVDPLRFGDLELCYLEATFEARDVAAFFLEGAYDPKLQALDYARRGLVTCGELVTMFFSLAEAREYAAPVLVVTGDEDDIFCNPLINLLPASCGSGPTSMLAQARALYPAASVYDWYAVPNAGHCWNLHYTAQKGFNASHAWLTGLGF